MSNLIEKHAEFERNLWDHAADEFQTQFDERRELTGAEIAFFDKLQGWIVEPSDTDALQHLRAALIHDPDKMALVLQLCGLTRNKILTDLRGSSAARGLNIPSDYRRLPATSSWALAGPYLLNRLRAVLGRMDGKSPSRSDVYEALNQATWPGYIRQQRAKLSGHEAEYRMAVLLSSCDIPFAPSEKAENPLCRDAQIGGISFDLVVPSVNAPLIVVKSTVHTANIGQYGESKDHLEVTEARQWLDTNFTDQDRPTLLAFIDGVGFRSNRAGLAGVLDKSDEFCQFKTLWKTVTIAAKRLNLPFSLALPEDSIREHANFLRRWGVRGELTETDKLDSMEGWITAGEGFIRR